MILLKVKKRHFCTHHRKIMDRDKALFQEKITCILRMICKFLSGLLMFLSKFEKNTDLVGNFEWFWVLLLPMHPTRVLSPPQKTWEKGENSSFPSTCRIKYLENIVRQSFLSGNRFLNSLQKRHRQAVSLFDTIFTKGS